MYTYCFTTLSPVTESFVSILIKCSIPDFSPKMDKVLENWRVFGVVAWILVSRRSSIGSRAEAGGAMKNIHHRAENGSRERQTMWMK